MSEPPSAPALAEVDAMVEAALAHHLAGRLDEAENLYVTALQAAPQHWRVLNNLGGLYLDRGQSAKALAILERAMAVAPEGAETWVSYARALINTGVFDGAERLIAAHTDHARAEVLEVRLRQAWGMALVQGSKPQAAADQFRRVLERRPDDPNAHGDLGYALLAAGDLGRAAESLERATRFAPESAAVRLNLGSALFKLGRADEAEAQYRRVLALEPRNTAAARNLGVLLRSQGRDEEAQALAESAGPELRAMAASRRAERAASLGRHEEVLAAFEELAALNPGDPAAVYSRAFARLILRDFEGGWADYQARWRMPRFVDESTLIANPPITTYFDPELSIDRLAGRRVLLVAEQGVGDQLMFASMIPDLLQIAGPITLVCDDRLARLFATSFPQVQVMGASTAQPALRDFDKVVAMGDLGRLFRNRAEAFPGAPYLHPSAAARERWQAKLGRRSGALRVGLSWRGGVAKTGAARRSVTLDDLAPLLDLPGCEFVSLQYGEVAEELARFNADRIAPIRAFPADETDDFEDLAALVQSLDVVVSVQTALAHLTGALGVRCLTLVSHRPEWVFAAEGETIPWYRSLRLLRQPEPDDWATPMGQASEMLKSRKGG